MGAVNYPVDDEMRRFGRLRQVPRSAYLTEPVLWGGERWTRGGIIAQLQREGVERACIDRALQGLDLYHRLHFPDGVPDGVGIARTEDRHAARPGT